MTRILFAAVAALPLLATPVLAQEGGSVFTNAPNELPQFANGTPSPADWAGPFFHSRIRTPARPPVLSENQRRHDRGVG
jgi:hypothetical protein